MDGWKASDDDVKSVDQKNDRHDFQERNSEFLQRENQRVKMEARFFRTPPMCGCLLEALFLEQ